MSSKLDEYLSEKNLHNSMVEAAYKAQNIHQYKDSSCDKYGLTIGEKWHDKGERMGFLTGHRGFYGSSGCTYQATPRLAHYLMKVINLKMQELVEIAIRISAADLEAVRKLANDEAKKVLEETSELEK